MSAAPQPDILLLLGVAQVPAPVLMDGVKLTPTLRGGAASLREVLHVERGATYGAEQLFDLERDPREEHDLARTDSARDAVAKWRARLVRELASRPEGVSDGERLVPGCPYPAVQKRAAR